MALMSAVVVVVVAGKAMADEAFCRDVCRCKKPVRLLKAAMTTPANVRFSMTRPCRYGDATLTQQG
jgi:hypothetical protein